MTPILFIYLVVSAIYFFWGTYCVCRCGANLTVAMSCGSLQCALLWPLTLVVTYLPLGLMSYVLVPAREVSARQTKSIQDTVNKITGAEDKP